jgi:hypothetical protein
VVVQNDPSNLLGDLAMKYFTVLLTYLSRKALSATKDSEPKPNHKNSQSPDLIEIRGSIIHKGADLFLSIRQTRLGAPLLDIDAT